MDSWDFNKIQNKFDKHVKDHLPWYDQVSKFVCDVASSFLPQNGKLLDVGASTGNISYILKHQISAKNIIVESIEPIKFDNWRGVGKLHNINAENFRFSNFRADVYILFLTLMFIKPQYREFVLKEIMRTIRPGGAIIIIDKGQLGISQSAVKVAHLASKMESNISGEDYITKELSLRGVLRTTNKEKIIELLEETCDVEQIFQMGEFYGLLAIRDTL